MLHLHPNKCAKASNFVHHNWLDGVLVRGKIDVICWAEEDKARMRQREVVGGDMFTGRDMSPNSKLMAI